MATRMLEPPAIPLYCPRLNRSVSMLALGIIIGFVVVLGAINYFEFGRVD
jgi:hypothetical protein